MAPSAAKREQPRAGQRERSEQRAALWLLDCGYGRGGCTVTVHVRVKLSIEHERGRLLGVESSSLASLSWNPPPPQLH